jgi:glucose-6-phosphate isomerase
VSTNLPACAEFGVPESRVFGFWDWVGGRYSLWGAIGLPVAMAVGAEGSAPCSAAPRRWTAIS